MDGTGEPAYGRYVDGAREVAWAVPRSRTLTSQIRADYDSLVDEVEGTWGSLFPRRLGYRTRIEALTDASVRLTVSRWDFCGQVELCCDWDRGDEVLIRAVASSRSRLQLAAAAAGERAIRRARRAATVVGGLIGAGFCWFAAGVQMPLIGGLMLTVILVSLMVGGGTLGARVGEALASRWRRSAEQARLADPASEVDRARWIRFERQLRAHRRTLARGLNGAPFRRVF